MSEDHELAMPCDQALLAATLALMTAYARPATDARVDTDTQRRLMARKIVSNLFFLREHPRLSASMRQVVDTVHRHWEVVASTHEAGHAATCRPGAPPSVRALH